MAPPQVEVDWVGSDPKGKFISILSSQAQKRCPGPGALPQGRQESPSSMGGLWGVQSGPVQPAG